MPWHALRGSIPICKPDGALFTLAVISSRLVPSGVAWVLGASRRPVAGLYRGTRTAQPIPDARRNTRCRRNTRSRPSKDDAQPTRSADVSAMLARQKALRRATWCGAPCSVRNGKLKKNPAFLGVGFGFFFIVSYVHSPGSRLRPSQSRNHGKSWACTLLSILFRDAKDVHHGHGFGACAEHAPLCHPRRLPSPAKFTEQTSSRMGKSWTASCRESRFQIKVKNP
jgi:hypothetical protein